MDDLREKDMELLGTFSLEGGWHIIWEDSLHKDTNKSVDDNQNRWHLSRMSFLAGYLHAKGKSRDEIIIILDNHREQSKDGGE